MIPPSPAIQEFINSLWPLALHDESIFTQGRLAHTWFTTDGERYSMDFSHCGNRSDWYQFDSRQDAWYFGQWVNPVTRQILSYVEGDITLVICETADQYRKELESMTDFEGRDGLDDHDHRHWEKLEQGKEIE
ncbi:hypothetical protein [Desulfobacter postgatei]|uniref:Uncharacterized protein n=1 Tax=Desulfobacter postgatei 2ac9 TaxID=879212 RepID=I5B7M4_9BACT|nr:hypothetical protein [Desulfobacter postgatei]EIM65487.1 hypothetical protein DespoDRAFT_03752 [Desulfobacter postgatei 2ac9]